MFSGVIADDLTSAADGGAPFARAGHTVFVEFQGSSAPLARAADIVAIDLDSRTRPETEAAALAAAAGSHFQNAALLLKTMDSTLRGHVGAEVAAVLRASGRRTAVVMPAFPAAGRTTVGGVQCVDGVPVHRTSFAHDPRQPVVQSRVADLFGHAGLGSIIELTAPEAHDPIRIGQAIGAGRVVVVDAQTDADLDAILTAVGAGDGVLWVGSPGLAQALARAHPASGTGLPMAQPGASRPLVLAGSLHPASRTQVEILAAATEMPPVRIALAAAGPAGWAAVAERAGAECRSVARRGGPIIVQSTAAVVPGGAATAAACLAEVARSLAADGPVDGLIATGGDTARAAVGALGARGLRLWGEMEPGVPVGILDGPHPLPVITKAGGFGDQGTLVRLCKVLCNPVSPLYRERLST